MAGNRNKTADLKVIQGYRDGCLLKIEYITKKNLFLHFFLFVLLFTWIIAAQAQQQSEPRNSLKQTKQERKFGERRLPGLQIVNTDATLMSVSHPVLPVEIVAWGIPAENVRLDILKVVSEKNSIVPVKFDIQPPSNDIYPQPAGKVYIITFDTTDLKAVDPGIYSIFLSVLSDNYRPQVFRVSFKLESAKTSLSVVSRFFKRLKEDLISVVWTVIEIIFFIIIIGLMIWLIRLAFRGRNSLSVLSIVNETGKSGELEGVASGIDDILLACLQDIREKSSIAQVKHYWLTDTTMVKDRGDKGTSSAQMSNVMSGGVPVDLHKLGDISIGPVKIPLGTIVSYITKLFGGNYVTGALQQYGTINKIVLKLEKRPIFYKRNPEVRFFEVTWPSEAIPKDDIAEGVPQAIEELGYRITLNITKEIGTINWLAYKYFLDGIICFRDYEENRTRKDRLIDSVTSWRESIRLDAYFAKAHYNLGVALDMLKKYEDALFRYQKAIQLSEKLAGAEAHYNIAKLYWDIYKDDDKTLEELREAKKLDASLSNIYNLEGLVHATRKDYKKAVELYQEAIKHCKNEINPIFYYNQSVAFYNLSDFESAKTAGEKGLKLYGDKIERQAGVLQTMGLIYLKKGEYEKSLKYFEQGLQLEPENYHMLHGYGIALRESDQTEKAITMHRRAIRLWPEYGNGYIELAKTLAKSEKWKKEAEMYEKMGLALNTDDLYNPMNQKDADLFLQNCQQYLLLSKMESDWPFLFNGIIASILYLFFQQYEKSIEYFRKAFQEKSDQINYLVKPELLNNFGLVLSKLAAKSPPDIGLPLYNESCILLQQAINLYDEHQIYDLAKCHSDLADGLMELKDYAQADKSYVKSANYFKDLKLNMKASDQLVKDAKCLMDWAIFENKGIYYSYARDECNKAISIDSTNYQAFHYKGLTYYDYRLYNEAIPQFEKAIEINFNLTGAQYNLGLCYKNLGNYEIAASKFKAIIKLDENYADPENKNKPDPYKQLFLCNEKLGCLDESEQLLRNATNIFPNSIKYSLLLGNILVKRKMLDEAAGIYEYAIQGDPDNLQNLRHLALNALADLYAKQGIEIERAYTMNREALSLCQTSKSYLTSPEEDLAIIRGTMGWIFFQKGQFRKSVLFLERSILHRLDDPNPYAHLALAYGKLSHTCSSEQKQEYVEKSARLWEQVAKLDTRNEWKPMTENQGGVQL